MFFYRKTKNGVTTYVKTAEELTNDENAVSITEDEYNEAAGVTDMEVFTDD